MMQVEWDGKTYTYDFRKITITQAVTIKAHTGHGLGAWQEACSALEPADVQALLWTLKAQNGEPCAIGSLDFPMLEFVEAFGAGIEPEDDSPKGGTDLTGDSTTSD